MWDPSSLIRDQSHTPCIGRQSLNKWTTRDVVSIVSITFLLENNQTTLLKIFGGIRDFRKNYYHHNRAL